MEEVRPPVALLWTVVLERIGEEIKSDDAHPLTALAEQRVGLIDTPDEARTRFSAGCKPGTVRSRRIERIVLEDLVSARVIGTGLAIRADVRERSPV